MALNLAFKKLPLFKVFTVFLQTINNTVHAIASGSNISLCVNSQRCYQILLHSFENDLLGIQLKA